MSAVVQAAPRAPAKTFIGKPCTKCRSVVRAVVSGRCVACHHAAKAKHRAAHREEARTYTANWRNDQHPGRGKAAVTRYRAKYPDRKRADSARYRARKLGQMCGCCTTKQLAAEFYGWNGGGAEVEHILSLRAAELLGVRGAHCRRNMRLYTKADHKAKTRLDHKLIAALRHEPDLPGRHEVALAHYDAHDARAAGFLRSLPGLSSATKIPCSLPGLSRLSPDLGAGPLCITVEHA